MWQCSCPHVHPLHPIPLLPYTLTPIMPTQYERSWTALRTAQDSSCHWVNLCEKSPFLRCKHSLGCKNAALWHATNQGVFQSKEMEGLPCVRNIQTHMLWERPRQTNKYRSHLPLQPPAGKTPPHHEYNDHHSLYKVVIPFVLILSHLNIFFYCLFISIPFSFSFVVAFPLKNVPCVTLLPSLQVQLPSSFSGNHRG